MISYTDISGEKDLETTIDQYDSILESIENGVFLVDEDLEFVDVNRSYSELSGYSRDELIGSSISRVISDADLAAAIEVGEEVIAEERNVGSIETDLETADGNTIPILSKFIPTRASDGSVETIGVVQNLSEQKEHEHKLAALHEVSRELVETRSREEICDLLANAMTETLDHSGVVVYLRDGTDATFTPVAYSEDVEERYEMLLTQTATPETTMQQSTEIQTGLFIPLGSHGGITIADHETHVFDERTVEMADTLAATAESALNQVDREEEILARERTVTTLHDSTRDLMQAETKESICRVAMTAATELLDFSSVGVFLWNEQRGRLEPSALTPDIRDRLDAPPVFESGNSLAWGAFIDGEVKRYTDLRDEERRYNRETPLRSELIIPIGNHGVFLTGSTSIDAYDEVATESAELLVANVGAALDRATREQNVREQEQRLHVKNQRLKQVDQINTVIRNVVGSIVHATSSNQLMTRVCEHLIGTEPYCFARFAVRNSETGEIESRTSSERETAESEVVLSSSSGEDGHGLPVQRVFTSEEPEVIENVLAYEGCERWRKAALERGYQSAIGVPVRYGNAMYGVLEIYGTYPSMFTGEEYDVLVELGDILGNAINAIKRTEALLAGSDTELEFRIPEISDPLFHLASTLDRQIELDALVPMADDSWLLYVIVDGCDPGEVVETAGKHHTVRKASHIRSESRRKLFGIVMSEPTSFTALAEHGATMKTLSIGEGEGSITLTIPRTTDVRTFVDTCLDLFPDAEFVRRGQVRTTDESRDPVDSISAQLTARQQEAVELAYQCGYFAWPRERTGDEIAEMMGITSPTFHSHLRKGLNALLGSIVAGDRSPDLTD